MNNPNGNTLRSKQVRRTLDRLYAAARADRRKIRRLMPKLALARLRGKKFEEVMTPSTARDIYLPVSREQGRFLYQTARAARARIIVEFGTSFGISTLYLASAVRDNGGGIVVGTEIEPHKHAQAVRNLTDAGLAGVTDIRLGDAAETLKEVDAPLDMVFLDGWKRLYLPILELLSPRIRTGGVVLADNIFTFKKALAPYVDYVQSGENGFESVTVPIGEGLEYSIRTG